VRYNNSTDLTGVMTQTPICPGCGSVNKANAQFCQGCGRARCPQCGSLNTDAVMFCAKCGGTLPSSKEPVVTETGSSEKPYVVWEGWPFAPLARRSQTRGQFIVSLWIGVIGLAILIPILAYVVVWTGGTSTGVCLLAFLIIGAPLSLWFSWWVGRRGAEE
jgi:uncharacterized membrane protein YvbJ